MLLDKVAELNGQRNAIDGQLVDIVAEIDRDGLAGMTGARSIPALVAWMTGVSPRNAQTIAAVAHRLPEFPKCAAAMREGRFSLDQVGTIAERAADGSDAHYAQLAERATVNQLRTAIKLEPRPPTRTQARTQAVDQQDFRRAVHHLSDHPAARRGGGRRRRTRLASRRADRAVETRPP